MQKRNIVYNIQGMGQDVISSPLNTTMAYEIHNMRLTPTKNSNALEITTEKGTLMINLNETSEGHGITLSTITNGIIIGYCILLDYIVLFIKGDKIYDETTNPHTWIGGPDYIYRLKKTASGYTSKLLFEGDLNFDVNSDIEATSYFENTKIQKIYWVDGINQPRLINIYGKEDDPSFDVSIDTPTFPITDFDSNHPIHTEFDFLQEVLQTSSSARIKAKKTYTGGNFTSGVILYAYSLYKNNSQETPIIDTTSLLYITHSDRGGAPNEQCGCSFEITIENRNLKNDFDYIRLYSILRNSLNGTPLARVVSDIPFAEEVTVIDDGNGGYDYDYNQLQYQRIPIHPLTLTLKDNVLFMGNYDVEYNINDLSKLYDKGLLINCDNWDVTPDLNHWDSIYGVSVYDPNDISVYPWLNQLDTESAGVKTFKYGETYKLGVQFQDKYGNWSLPYFIMDKQLTVHPYVDANGYLRKPIFYCDVNDIYDSLSQIEKDNYVRIRPVVSLPSMTERSVLCQGVLNPTVFNITERCNKTCYALSSWFFRPIVKLFNGINSTYAQLNNGAINEYRHFEGLCNSGDIGGEIQGIYYDDSALDASIYNVNFNSSLTSSLRPKSNIVLLIYTNNDKINNYKNFYFIDLSVLTLNSPDIEFSNILDNPNVNNKLDIVGYISADNNTGNFNIVSQSPFTFKTLYVSNPNRYIRGQVLANGFYNYKSLNIRNGSNFSGNLSSVNAWFDDNAEISDLDIHIDLYKNLGTLIGEQPWNKNKLEFAYTIYPWLRNYLNNYSAVRVSDEETETSKITLKILSNFRLSNDTIFLLNNHNLPIGDILLCNENTITLSVNDHKIYNGNYNKYLNYNNEYYGINDLNILDPSDSNQERIGYPIMFDFSFKIAYPFDSTLTINRNYLEKIIDYNDFISNSESLPTDAFWHNYKLLDKYNISSSTSTFDITSDYMNFIPFNTVSISQDPILISYKSNKHCVIQLDSKTISNEIYRCSLPLLYTNSYVDSIFISLLSNNDHFPWYDENDTTYDYDLKGYYRDIIGIQNDFNTIDNYLFIASLSKLFDLDGYGYPINSYLNRWNTEDDPLNPYLENISNLYLRNWIPAGKAQQFVKIPGSTTNTIAWIEGDTYYQRYDCVKTKPYSEDSYQSVIEILSFMVESNINLDGRYDKNRGILDYTIISDDNFNLFNDVYNQENNFFTYHILDPAKFNIDEFRNDIIWSQRKISGESVDQWTKMSTINQLQLDGNKGFVKALRKFNDNIYCFQDHAVSRIRFNDRTAIATESGEPLQLAFTNYVDGYEYVNSDIGCQYGISCCETENGIFFIDNDIPGIYKLSYNEYGNANVKNISKLRFMQRWFEREGNIKRTRVFFDKPVNEILICAYTSIKSTENYHCIVYSCDMDSFQQFINDYGKSRYIFTHNNWPIAITQNNIKLWKLREYGYSQFLSSSYTPSPYSITFVASPLRSNEGLVLDCIYNNIYFKADVFRNSSYNFETTKYEENESFDYIDAKTVYQDNHEVLQYTDSPVHSITNLRKKFGSWFARIPRFHITLPAGRWNKERMRGNCIMLSLVKQHPNINDKMIFKELSVDCFY